MCKSLEHTLITAAPFSGGGLTASGAGTLSTAASTEVAWVTKVALAEHSARQSARDAASMLWVVIAERGRQPRGCFTQPEFPIPRQRVDFI